MKKGMAERSEETSNLFQPEADEIATLLQTLEDWNTQLKHAKIDFRGPSL